jgi:hypothetical protein
MHGQRHHQASALHDSSSGSSSSSSTGWQHMLESESFVYCRSLQSSSTLSTTLPQSRCRVILLHQLRHHHPLSAPHIPAHPRAAPPNRLLTCTFLQEGHEPFLSCHLALASLLALSVAASLPTHTTHQCTHQLTPHTPQSSNLHCTAKPTMPPLRLVC